MIFSATTSACSKEAPPTLKVTVMTLSSIAFEEGGKIPVKYTRDGQNISPPLNWSEPPQQTQVFAIIVDDPDAAGGAFTHWILFNIPTSDRELPEGISTQEQIENGALQGKNDFGRIGYDGPSPPKDATHKYRFTIYALDNPLNLNSGASRKQLVDAMSGHILSKGELLGTYGH